MSKVYNIHEALRVLTEMKITGSLQVLSRWLREGKIQAERTANLKEGWRIKKEHLIDFIRRENESGLLMRQKYMDDLNKMSFVELWDNDVDKGIEVEEEIQLNPTEEKLIKGEEQFDQKLKKLETNFQKQYEELKIEIDKQLSALKEQNAGLIEVLNALTQQIQNLNIEPEIEEQICNESKRKDQDEQYGQEFQEEDSLFKDSLNELNQSNINQGEIEKIKSQNEKLIEEVNELIKEVGKLNKKKNGTPRKKSKKEPIEIPNMSYEAFVEILKEFLPKDYMTECKDNVQKIYYYYFDGNGQLNEDFIKTNGKFTCPDHPMTITGFEKFLLKDVKNHLEIESKTDKADPQNSESSEEEESADSDEFEMADSKIEEES